MGAPEVAQPEKRLTRLLRGPIDVGLGFVRALPRAVEDMFRDRCPQYAAAIGFRALFSLFPLTILLVSIFGLVLQNDELRNDVIEELIGVLPVSPEGEEDIRSSIESLASPFSAIGLVSLVALLWGASGMMASIRVGLEAALKVDQGRPAARAKLVDFVLVGVAGLLVIVVIGISTFAALFGRAVEWLSDELGVELVTTPTGALVSEGLQLVLIASMTLALYRYVPARAARPESLAGGRDVHRRRDLGRREGARRAIRRHALQLHLRLARERDGVPLLRLRRRVHPPARGRVRLRVVTAAWAARAAATRSDHRRRPRARVPPGARRTAPAPRRQRQTLTGRDASPSRPETSEATARRTCGPFLGFARHVNV